MSAADVKRLVAVGFVPATTIEWNALKMIRLLPEDRVLAQAVVIEVMRIARARYARALLREHRRERTGERA